MRLFQSTAMQRLAVRNTTIILSIVLVFATTGCGDGPSALLPETNGKTQSGSNPLVGYWVRMDDIHGGAIIVIAEEDNDLIGRLVHVSDTLQEFGFGTGQVKLKNFTVMDDDGQLTMDSLVHSVNAFSGHIDTWYDHGIARVSRDEILWRQEQYENRNGGEWQRWVRIDESSSDGSNLLHGLGELSVQRGQWDSAMDYFRRAVKRDRSTRNVNSYAWYLAVAPDAKYRDPALAIELATEVCKRTHFNEPNFLDTLAAAYAAHKDWPEAVRYQLQACQNLESLHDGYFMRLVLYRERTAYVAGMARDISREDILSSLSEATGRD